MIYRPDYSVKCYLFIRHSMDEKSCYRLWLILKKDDTLFLTGSMHLKNHGTKIRSSLLRLPLNITQSHANHSTFKKLWTVRVPEEMLPCYHWNFQIGYLSKTSHRHCFSPYHMKRLKHLFSIRTNASAKLSKSLISLVLIS